MPTKKKSLTSSMQAAAGNDTNLPEETTEQKSASQPKLSSSRAPVREGTRAIGGHFAPEVLKQLKLIALENDTTNQKLLGEALNLLFANYGKPPIA
ncbi:ribbon-helix-helix domain-containing protein [Acaryochloris sp. CCMEE 5410]|uniref:ribbon-helix-helix domain-containing protein n=1 Tax=Acaryochloris sp. CCMEE 5410 TaxID=310037 RepID=UPI00024844FA|nr:ribbon-helix-helix domain-containing protein [Acaryochloris sp. CCMEE 5410]